MGIGNGSLANTVAPLWSLIYIFLTFLALCNDSPQITLLQSLNGVLAGTSRLSLVGHSFISLLLLAPKPNIYMNNELYCACSVEHN